ncbi:Bromodomain-containing protein-like protein [Tricladium varicosporioides]|nr:Bromodomain-containing protein-like protein [Hymenoscyphus varicosporioides]
MDSKRKVNGGGNAAGDDLDDRAAKRRKGPSDGVDLSQGETAETTTQHGLKLVEILKKTEDKSGRRIATSFITLPNEDKYPDYYKAIIMPISLDTIKGQLEEGFFKNMTQLESHFKRMISNAKEYNQKGSEIYDDAERLRKALSNFMTKTNPAYKNIPGYVAAPTPLPSKKINNDEDEDAEGEPDSEAERRAIAKKARGRPSKNPKSHTPVKSATPAVAEGRHTRAKFDNLTFQEAQEKILEDLIEEKEHPDDDYTTFEVFVELPPKSIKDYYKIIQHPTSLQTVQHKVKNGSAGSEFKSWGQLEAEMSNIWRNAWTYNEDGSAISLLAQDLKTQFNKLLQAAKKAVQEPPVPKIKLKMPEPAPKITLKLGSRPSPVESPAPQTNGSNGTAVNGRRNPFGSSQTAAALPSLDQLERARSASGSIASPTTSNAGAVKNEDGARNSPAVVPQAQNNYRAPSQTVSTPGPATSGMLPPTTPGLPNNNMYSAGGYAQSFPHPHQPQFHVQNPAFESKWRQPGKSASDAMITNLSLATHPGLNISRHLKMDIPPSPSMAQQSVTINLPHTHYYLQIKPTIASTLIDRQYKLFVTSGNQRLHAMPTIPGHQVDQRNPLFEARLLPGVNRIDVELIAALPKGANKSASGQDVELEKVTIFANLLKDPQQR